MVVSVFFAVPQSVSPVLCSASTAEVRPTNGCCLVVRKVSMFSDEDTDDDEDEEEEGE
jgi:hypothetical protein